MKQLFTRITFITFVLFLIAACSSGGGNEKPRVYGDNTTDKLLAYNFSTGFVKDRLKSPRTAKFAKLAEKVDHVIYVRPNEYRINSYVDAQNSLGVMIRSRYSCTITFKDGSAICTNLTID